MSVTQTIELFQATDRRLRFTNTAPPVNITGQSFVFYVRDGYDGCTVLIADMSVIEDAINGVFYFDLTQVQTALPAKVYVWEVRRVDAGFVDTVADGDLIMRPKVA